MIESEIKFFRVIFIRINEMKFQIFNLRKLPINLNSTQAAGKLSALLLLYSYVFFKKMFLWNSKLVKSATELWNALLVSGYKLNIGLCNKFCDNMFCDLQQYIITNTRRSLMFNYMIQSIDKIHKFQPSSRQKLMATERNLHGHNRWLDRKMAWFWNQF